VRPAARAALVLAVGVAGTSAAPAGAEHRLQLFVGTNDTGWIGLRVHGERGVPVTIEEPGKARIAEFTPEETDTRLRRVARWRCERRTRRFVATTADGQRAVARVRTPSCSKRLVVVMPGQATVGGAVQARVVDRWGTGDIRARVCVLPPGGPAQCRRSRLSADRDRIPVRFEALRPGGWRVSVRTPFGRALGGVRASHPGGGLSVLATGDSMMHRLDTVLLRKLAALGVRARSDAHDATGISKSFLLDWQSYAHRQAASNPDVVVMFLGANDYFTMGDARCCGAAWEAEYSRRVHGMMEAYARGGRTRVLWLTLPTPRDGWFVRQSFPAVNRAIRKAAAPMLRDVGVVDLVKRFSPGGKYRTWIRVRGEQVGVRHPDGIHLSDRGAAIAASIVFRTLRRERIIR
jgi:lysophospholipase L1-like esterase